MSTLEGTEFLMLQDGQVRFEGSPHELRTSDDPYIKEFLS
jgi:ABC-type transporter Mla maintaining outer membrane lipid asymmetry ATPase subunit MlaF